VLFLAQLQIGVVARSHPAAVTLSVYFRRAFRSC